MISWPSINTSPLILQDGKAGVSKDKLPQKSLNLKFDLMFPKLWECDAVAALLASLLASLLAALLAALLASPLASVDVGMIYIFLHVKRTSGRPSCFLSLWKTRPGLPVWSPELCIEPGTRREKENVLE